ncbi:hypothetical protein D3C80_131190 [compost metagenome]
MPYFSLRVIFIFTLFLVHQSKAKDIPVLNSAPIKFVLNEKAKLFVWPSFVMYAVYTVILVCVYLPNKSQVQAQKYCAKG